MLWFGSRGSVILLIPPVHPAPISPCSCAHPPDTHTLPWPSIEYSKGSFNFNGCQWIPWCFFAPFPQIAARKRTTEAWDEYAGLMGRVAAALLARATELGLAAAPGQMPAALSRELGYEGGLEEFGRRVAGVAICLAENHGKALEHAGCRLQMLQLVSRRWFVLAYWVSCCWLWSASGLQLVNVLVCVWCHCPGTAILCVVYSVLHSIHVLVCAQHTPMYTNH